MRRLLPFCCALLGLSACTTALPTPDPQLAWVDLQATAGERLMAQELDGERVDDGRYFQLSPGAHELEVSFQHETQLGGGLGFGEVREVTCDLRLRYADFAAGQRYRLQARPLLLKAQAWLYDDQQRVLARAELLRCRPY